MDSSGCAALILVPTRELALQTSQVCKELGKHMNIEVMVSTGGTSLKEDIMRLYSKVHILVATPGRVLDLANKRVADLSNCTTIVMDEVCAPPSLPSSLPHPRQHTALAPHVGMLSAVGTTSSPVRLFALPLANPDIRRDSSSRFRGARTTLPYFSLLYS